jgi:hypothetical protein
LATLDCRSRVAEATPWPLGGGLATPKGQKNGFGHLADPLPRAKKMGLVIGGGRSTPKGHWGLPPHTGHWGWQKFWPMGVADPPQGPEATPNGRYGVASATPMALGGGSATPKGQTHFFFGKTSQDPPKLPTILKYPPIFKNSQFNPPNFQFLSISPPPSISIINLRRCRTHVTCA